MEHKEIKGLVSMRPGHRAGQACTCGWHSHTQTFEDHVEEAESQINTEAINDRGGWQPPTDPGSDPVIRSGY